MSSSPDMPAGRVPGAWRSGLAAFWSWWSGEIAAFARLRFAALLGEAAVPVVAFEGEELALVEPRAAAGPDSRVDLGALLDEPRRRAALRALLERAGESRDRVRLCLGRDEALVRRIAMPAATEENLRQVLAFEMDRLTPFRADDVYFDYRVVGRDAAAGRLSVALAVAQRKAVDGRLATLRALGANVQGVTVREDATGIVQPLDLLPSEQRGEAESSNERIAQRALVAAVVLLFLLALAVPIWRKRETVIALQPLAERARQQAEATDRLAHALEREVSDYNFLLAKKHGTYPVLAYVEEASRLLPDNTWVQQLDIRTAGKGREVQVSGETTSSSKLIEILEQSKLLQNATSRGTITRGSTPNSERFMIAAEARPHPLPEPVRLSPPGPEAPPAAAAPKAPPAPAAKPGGPPRK